MAASHHNMRIHTVKYTAIMLLASLFSISAFAEKPAEKINYENLNCVAVVIGNDNRMEMASDAKCEDKIADQMTLIVSARLEAQPTVRKWLPH
jgi:hypothetical protein